MPDFTAKDVQAAPATGVGMLDAKRALEETGGDMDKASSGCASRAWPARPSAPTARPLRARWRWPCRGARGRHRPAAVRDRLRGQGRDFVDLADELADLVAAKGEEAVAERAEDIDELKITLKENISVGQVVRIEAAGRWWSTYLHLQAGRGVNAVVVALRGGGDELAHDIAAHIAFARPLVPHPRGRARGRGGGRARDGREIARNEGKPEAALPKIVEGRLNGWYKERVSARPALRQGREADHRQAPRERRDRAVRPGRRRRLRSPGPTRWRR